MRVKGVEEDLAVWEEGYGESTTKERPTKPKTKWAKRRNVIMKRSNSIIEKPHPVKKLVRSRKRLLKKYRVMWAIASRRKKLRLSFAMAAKKLRSPKKPLGVIIRERRLTLRRAAVKRLIKSKKVTSKSDTERIEKLEKEIVILKESLDDFWKLGYENGYEDGYKQGANTK